MENTRNPGALAIAAGVGLGVLFLLLGLTGVLQGRIGFGLAAVSLVVSALVYIFYTRGNPVTKAGYGSLVMLVAIGLIIPVLTINQQQSQTDLASAQYDLTLHRGAAIYGQYCATCHGFQGQGLNGPKLNNSPDVAKLSDDDLTRVISAGIPGDPANPGALIMPAWLNTYGGSLTEEDIRYLTSFIRSSYPDYLATKGLPNVNGFGYVLASLINPTQVAQYNEQLKGGNKPPASQFTDLSGKTAVTVPIINTPGGVANWGFSPQYIIVSAGTTVTWNNVSDQIHTVVTRPDASPAPPATFKSAVLPAATGTFQFTFATPGDYPYYCSIHPAMVAWVEVK